MEEETTKWELDNGSAVYALGELRRRIGRSWDSTLSAMVGAIDRSGSAIIQADTAKTVQEEARHLVRALSAAGEVYVLAAEHAKGIMDGIFGKMGVPVEPPAANLLQAIDRSCSAVMQDGDGSTAQDEIRHLVRTLAAAAQVYALTAAQAKKTLDERRWGKP